MASITPFLWFDDQAEEAAHFYTAIFRGSRIVDIQRREGKAFVCTFDLNGMRFQALNGGPQFSFTEAVSFSVDCKDQAEVDYYWDRLLADGGKAQQCGWLKDRFGLSWQVVPQILPRLLADPDRDKAQRVMQAMLKMIKLDVAGLEAAARQG